MDGYISPIEARDHFNFDDETPFLIRKKVNWNQRQLTDLLVNGRTTRICSKKPLSVMENSSFVIDTSKLDHPDDWKFDEHGSWMNNGNSGFSCFVSQNGVTGITAMARRERDRKDLQAGQYLFLRTYWKHKKYSDFRRQAVTVTNHVGERLPLVLVEYFFTGRPHNVSPKKHGNAKSDRPFHPTSGSTRRKLKEATQHSSTGPSTIFDVICEDAGGMLQASSSSDLLRSVDQVKYTRRTF